MATDVMADLCALGVSESDISLIESEVDPRLPNTAGGSGLHASTRSAATLGCGIGLGLGVLVGVRAIATDLLAPVAALGWVVPTALGGALGAVLGALFTIATRRGRDRAPLDAMVEGLRRGEILLMVRVDASLVAAAQAVLKGERTTIDPPFAALEEPAPYDPVNRAERVVDPDGAVQVRYVRE